MFDLKNINATTLATCTYLQDKIYQNLSIQDDMDIREVVEYTAAQGDHKTAEMLNEVCKVYSFMAEHILERNS